MRLTRRGKVVLVTLWLGLVASGSYWTRDIDSDTGRPTHQPTQQTVTCWEDQACWQVGHPFDGKN
jgi:hypothetical protein